MHDFDVEEYVLKVHFGIFRKRFVKFINWENSTIIYTDDKYETGVFKPYSRACEIARFLENEPGITRVDVINVDDL